jgi:hypothetical protein
VFDVAMPPLYDRDGKVIPEPEVPDTSGWLGRDTTLEQLCFSLADGNSAIARELYVNEDLVVIMRQVAYRRERAIVERISTNQR